MSQFTSKQINEQNGEESCWIQHGTAPGMRGGIAGAVEERDAPGSLPAAAPRSWAGGRAARAHPRVQRRLLRSELGDASPDTLKVWGGSGLSGAGARPAAAGARRARSPRPAGTAPRRRRAKMASRSLRLLLLLGLGVLSYPDASGISIETDIKNVKAEEFKEAILSCKHKFSKGMSLRIEWKKIQPGVSFVYYNNEFTGDLRGRAEMLNTGIRIRNVTRRDSGTYRCEISAKSEEKQHLGEATITLTVLVAPTTPVCEVPSSAMTGTVVQMSCKETEGSPPSEYQWYKNGVALLEKTGTGSARAANLTYTMNKKSGTLLFNTVTKNDTGEYFCEASNGIGLSQKCSVKRMQVDDLNVSGIIVAVVFVALVMVLCGLGVFYAQKKGYFAKESSSQKKTNYQSTSEKDFKHTKSFVI
ncbi:junctional adhesion molecule B isoform X1 [Catharus ustulatus]|uniref:Junctional adhesion molecule 2 n=2 Tax=Catharus ustulatus TaxID=91951 RepID=A0A8C3TMH2_CATUS|nr:junctional adhesion molecule B isoform X1 [Catharus ustulatus]